MIVKINLLNFHVHVHVCKRTMVMKAAAMCVKSSGSNSLEILCQQML